MTLSPSPELPYHLRAPRLRWAALAIDLGNEESLSFHLVATDPSQPLKVRTAASLVLGLHQRKPIAQLCEELQMDRRTLFRIASDLAEPSTRKRFLIKHDAV